jgi:hypothetical protein
MFAEPNLHGCMNSFSINVFLVKELKIMDQKSWQYNIFIMLEDVKHFHHSEAEKNDIGVNIQAPSYFYSSNINDGLSNPK